jgi:hypothetical protein
MAHQANSANHLTLGRGTPRAGRCSILGVTKQSTEQGGSEMLELRCNACGQELNQPGALLFSPPTGDGWLVEKYHLCVSCWGAMTEPLRARMQASTLLPKQNPETN